MGCCKFVCKCFSLKDWTDHLGFVHRPKSNIGGRNAAQASCLSSSAPIPKHGLLLMSKFYLNHALFSPILENLLKITNLTWKASALYCSMTPVNSDFLQNDKLQRKGKQVICGLDAWKHVPGPPDQRDNSSLILKYSWKQKFSFLFFQTKIRSYQDKKRWCIFFTPRTATPTTWCHSKYHNIL